MEHLKHFDEILKYVNELSGTMDLGSTLVRAEGLFRRFEKTVEAVDRRSHFPAPGGRAATRRRTLDGKEPSRQAVASASTGTSTAINANRTISSSQAPNSPTSAVARESVEAQKEEVISPELRLLLSRKLIVLE